MSRIADEVELSKAGFCPELTTALAAREITPTRALSMTPTELLNEYLEWNGLIGWTGSILRVLRNAEQQGWGHGPTIPPKEPSK